MSSKEVFILFARLPLLFVVDSVFRVTCKDFGFGFCHQIEEKFIIQVLWNLLVIFVASLCVVLVFSPIKFILDFYRWISGAALIWISYNRNLKYVKSTLFSSIFEHKLKFLENGTDASIPSELVGVSYSSNLLIQLTVSLAFDQITVSRVFETKNIWVNHCRYPVDILLYISFSLPIFLDSLTADRSLFELYARSSVLLPLALLACHVFFAVYKVSQEVIIPGVSKCKAGIREMGLDGLLMNFVEKVNLSWLLRSFFIAQVIYQATMSKTLNNLERSLLEVEVLKRLILEVLHNLCGTLLSITSLASIVTIMSRFSLSCVYKLIQAEDEDESLQPVVSGCLFVLCAMQTGITSVSGDLRLQLLFQNSVLLAVANQHFVHHVATDLLLKASVDDSPLEKHIRPMLPFVFFFCFPFIIVMPLWSYNFRISWLLAVTVFCIELIIKSICTLSVYSINMLHTHTDVITDDPDGLKFYVKGGSGFLEFVCGIFLFLNGAYIFIFESGGLIRLLMMTIHFYCNIYQSMIKGWATYKLRRSSWETVNNLEPARQEQLDDNDICSICYQEMKDAVSLECNHIFHKGCLQKWLSIKETCPLCHGELNKSQYEDGAGER